jgi:hypothetical protein
MRGRLWLALAGFGRLREVLCTENISVAGFGRLWQALAGFGWRWQALAGVGRLWQALAGIYPLHLNVPAFTLYTSTFHHLPSTPQLRYILAYGWLINDRSKAKSVNCPLHASLYHDDPVVMHTLLLAGASVDCLDQHGRTPPCNVSLQIP